jgi:hypothetical protein
MTIPPTNSLLAALSSLGVDGVRPPAAPQGVRPPAAPAPGPANPVTAAAAQTAPNPAKPLPRGSLVNLVV